MFGHADKLFKPRDTSLNSCQLNISNFMSSIFLSHSIYYQMKTSQHIFLFHKLSFLCYFLFFSFLDNVSFYYLEYFLIHSCFCILTVLHVPIFFVLQYITSNPEFQGPHSCTESTVSPIIQMLYSL